MAAEDRAHLIFFVPGSVEILTTLLDSIAMEPRALGVSSTLAFVEHERGREFYE